LKKNSDQKDWENFLKNPSSVFDKDDIEKDNQKKFAKYKFDFHGYSIEDANKKIEYLISKSLEKGVKELLIITGKGTHSDKKDDVYVSKEYNKLQNTLPEFIKNNLELSSKIEKIKQAPKELGGSGAFILKLKKIKE
tara:strand:+ start:895 stop:1305 length:411 start_codon:yes stop_codon:yes gene_type:complete